MTGETDEPIQPQPPAPKPKQKLEAAVLLGKHSASKRDMAALGAKGGAAPHATRGGGRVAVPKPCPKCGEQCSSAREAWNHCVGKKKAEMAARARAKARAMKKRTPKPVYVYPKEML